MTEVAQRLIAHGLGHLDEVFGWRPAMGGQSPGQVADEVPIPASPESSGK